MAYSTVEDLTNYIPKSQLEQLTDDNDVGSIDADKLNDCIRRADDLIDGYLRGRYALPLTDIPPMVRDLSIKLAVYYLFKRSLILTMPEPITDDYKDANEKLYKIQRGIITPFPVQTDEPTFFATNKQNSVSVISTITNDWGSYLI